MRFILIFVSSLKRVKFVGEKFCFISFYYMISLFQTIRKPVVLISEDNASLCIFITNTKQKDKIKMEN